MAGLIVYFAVTSLLVVGASEYAQEFIDEQVRCCPSPRPPPPMAPASLQVVVPLMSGPSHPL